MADLFDPNPGLRDPQDSEAFRLGAGRLRDLKTTLQRLLLNIFADNTGAAFVTNTLPSSLLSTGGLGSGLAKPLTTSAVQVNYDGTTINVDASTPPKLQVKPLLFSSALQVIHADGGPSDLTVAHSLAAVPCFVRAVYIPQVTGTGQGVGAVDMGYALNDEIDILCANITVDQGSIPNPFEGYVTSGGTVTFYGYRPTLSADATNVYLTIPDGKIFCASKHNTAGVSPTFGVQINKANWKIKIYARTLA